MMFVSFLQRLGFRSEAPAPKPVQPAAATRRAGRSSSRADRSSAALADPKIGGITLGLPAEPAHPSAPVKSRKATPSAPPQSPSAAASVTKRRPVVKALAKKTATTAQPAKSKAPAPTRAEVAKPAAKAPGKPVAPAPATDTARAVPKTVSKKPASPAPQPVAKPVTKSASPAGAKVPAASKPAASAATKPAKAVAPPVASAPPVPKAPTAAAKAAAAKVQASVEPTPRPLGKRAAKKVMMEQMTQAEVVPTHAADAAKATFSSTNERVVMTPPVPSAIRKDPKRANNWKTLPVDQLVDEDVLAMPDEEYMSDLQLAYFRRKLSQLRADMLANAGETTEHLREDTVVVPDPADRATIEEEHALELRTRDRERKLLKKIEQAIARIDSGDYGYCDETGEAIGVGRLMARPTASLSLEAQQRRELKQKMFGD